MNDALEQRLLDFDGNAVTLLSEARTACRRSAGYFGDLAVLSCDPRANVANGATWIIKAELDDGGTLPPDVTDRIVASLGKIQSWQAALHLLQSVEGLGLTSAQAEHFLAWAKPYANHARPFLRAWSLHARVMLGHEFAEFGHEVNVAVETAEADHAASVRARARRLRTTLGL